MIGPYEPIKRLNRRAWRDPMALMLTRLTTDHYLPSYRPLCPPCLLRLGPEHFGLAVLTESAIAYSSLLVCHIVDFHEPPPRPAPISLGQRFPSLYDIIADSTFTVHLPLSAQLVYCLIPSRPSPRALRS